MRKFTPREMAIAAIVAAMYTVMGYFGNVFGLTFGPIQIRFAEALTVLPFLFPATAPGLAIGCLLTNLLSPYGPIDVVMGTLATAVAAWLTVKMPRWYLAGIPPIVMNLIVLPPMWAWTEVGGFVEGFWGAWAYNAVTFVIGEVVACYVLGTVLLKLLPKIPGLPIPKR